MGFLRQPAQTQNHYSTRISKIEFPRFDGSKVKEWLYKCEQFFSLDNTPLESKVRLASIHLEDSALQWHLNYMWSNFNIYPSWPQYISDITMRFGGTYEDPLSSLIQVKQTRKVQEYIDEFELALTQVTLPPEHSLSIFLAGLENNTQMHVKMFGPKSIAHAANLAMLHESSNSSLMGNKFSNRPNSSSYKTTSFDNKISSGANSVHSNPPTKPIISKTPRTYSASEMAERRGKGALYVLWWTVYTRSPIKA